MSEVIVLWVGRRPGRDWEGVMQEYEARLARLIGLSQVRIRPEEGRASDPRRARAAEARRLRSHLRANDTVVVVDQRGRERSSEELSQWFSGVLQRERVVFVVGSDLGLDEELRRSAAESLSLSRMTLPHHLARLVLLEQLYRAADILAGGGYHRA